MQPETGKDLERKHIERLTALAEFNVVTKERVSYATKQVKKFALCYGVRFEDCKKVYNTVVVGVAIYTNNLEAQNLKI